MLRANHRRDFRTSKHHNVEECSAESANELPDAPELSSVAIHGNQNSVRVQPVDLDIATTAAPPPRQPGTLLQRPPRSHNEACTGHHPSSTAAIKSGRDVYSALHFYVPAFSRRLPTGEQHYRALETSSSACALTWQHVSTGGDSDDESFVADKMLPGSPQAFPRSHRLTHITDNVPDTFLELACIRRWIRQRVLDIRHKHGVNIRMVGSPISGFRRIAFTDAICHV